MRSSCATLTPQGIAIQDAADRFGNGETLPFTPCKRGYIPVVKGQKMYGCHLHNDKRKARVQSNSGQFKNGEKDLNVFWEAYLDNKIDDKNENQIKDGG